MNFVARSCPVSRSTWRSQSHRVLLSAAFPWHTDGAIVTKAPRWLLLRAVRVSHPTCTELLDPRPELWAMLRRTVLRATDRAGPECVIGPLRCMTTAVAAAMGPQNVALSRSQCISSLIFATASIG
jgi:hypothetical protein